MKLSHLKLVKIVAEVGNLSKAGEKLFLSQPALSHQLKELEEYCKSPVFKRIGKKMVPTNIGERIIAAAETVLGELNKLDCDLKSSFGQDAVNLKICSSCYTGYYWFPPIVKEFYELFPESEVGISHEANDDPLAYILSGEIDLAIVSRTTNDTNLYFTEAFKDEVFAIVPHGHKWENRKYVDVEEFAEEEVIIYPKPITAFQRILKEKGIVPKKVVKVQLTEARVEMVKAGLGLSVMANWAIKPYLERKEVVPIKITKKGLHRTWHIACLKNQAESRHMKKLIRIAKKKLKEI